MSMPDRIYDELVSLRKDIAVGVSLSSLGGHKAFQEVILRGYLEKEALTLVQALGNPLNGLSERQEIQRRLDAIGIFANYLQRVRDTAEMAMATLPETEKVFEELHAERL